MQHRRFHSLHVRETRIPQGAHQEPKDIKQKYGSQHRCRDMAQTLHQRGLKLVQDAVYNHVSDDHWLYKHQPFKDWFNQWPGYTGSSHKEQALYDPYASAADRKLLLDGWFTPFLPDLNLRNPFLATYLIQHANSCIDSRRRP